MYASVCVCELEGRRQQGRRTTTTTLSYCNYKEHTVAHNEPENQSYASWIRMTHHHKYILSDKMVEYVFTMVVEVAVYSRQLYIYSKNHDSIYSLCSASQRLHWAVVQKPNFRPTDSG